MPCARPVLLCCGLGRAPCARRLAYGTEGNVAGDCVEFVEYAVRIIFKPDYPKRGTESRNVPQSHQWIPDGSENHKLDLVKRNADHNSTQSRKNCTGPHFSRVAKHIEAPCRFPIGNEFQYSDETPGFKNVRTVFENRIPLLLGEEIAPLFCYHKEVVERVLAQSIP